MVGRDGPLVLITGEAGIGKSVLAEGSARLAEARGVTVARGYAVNDAGAPPLWPWLRVASPYPALQSALTRSGTAGTHDPDDPRGRFEVFVAVADEITRLAEDQGLVIILEDLQWADRTSLLLLRHLYAEMTRSRVLVIATLRDRLNGAVADVLPDLMRGDHSRVIALTALGVGDVTAWLSTVPGFARWVPAAADVCRRTGGNPLLIRLVIQALPVQGMASSDVIDRLVVERSDVRGLLTRPLAMLSDTARDVLTAASVIGERLSVDLLSEVSGRGVAEVNALLDEGVNAGLLRTGRDGIAFAHALVRDAIYNESPPSNRPQLHQRVALALESTGGRGQASIIAGHWHQASGTAAERAAVTWAARARDEARGMFAHDEAVRFAALAVDGAARLGAGDDVRAELLLELGQAQLIAGQLGPSLTSCVEAARLAEDADRPDLLAAAALVVQGVGSIDVYRVVRGLCERALARWPEDESATRARLLSQLVVTKAEESSPDTEQASLEALAVAERSCDSGAILEAIAARHLSITVPQTVDERLSLARRAVELGSRSDRPMAALWGHLWESETAFQLGDLTTVDRKLVEIDQIARERRSPIARWHHERLLAARSALLGEFAAARDHNERAFALARQMDDASTTGMYFAFRTQLGLTRGDPAEFGPVEAITAAPPMPLVRIAIPQMLAVQGRLDEARAAFAEFRHLPAALPVGVRWAATIAAVGSVAVLVADEETAGEVYDLLLPTAEYCTGDGSGQVFSLGSNARFLADLAVTSGQHDEAIRLYADAIAVNLRLGARPFVALSRLGWAQALLARRHAAATTGPRGDGSDLTTAAKLVEQAAAEFRRLDIPGPLVTADRLLSRLTIEARQLSPLSAREAEVAALLGEALSNREIADRLYLSERTVESHVHSILAKLGFSTRTEVATWAVRHA